MYMRQLTTIYLRIVMVYFSAMNLKAFPLCAIAIYTFIMIPLHPLFAQEFGDIIAPKIVHQPLNEPGTATHPIEIKATITDNDVVQEAILFYRLKGKPDYSSLTMNSQSVGIYVVIIPEDNVKEPGVEYYIQATDRAGNIVYKGVSSEPIIINVIAAPVPPMIAIIPLPLLKTVPKKNPVLAVPQNPVELEDSVDIKEPIEAKKSLEMQNAVEAKDILGTQDISPAKGNLTKFWYKQLYQQLSSQWLAWAIATVVVGGVVAANASSSGNSTSDAPTGGVTIELPSP